MEITKGIALAKDVLEGEPWLPTPLLAAKVIGLRLGAELWLKREDCSPVGSFKLRWGPVSMAARAGELTDAGVYVASAGNYGLAMALAGQRGMVTPQEVDVILRDSLGRCWSAAGVFETLELAGWDLVSAVAPRVVPDLEISSAVPRLLKDGVCRGAKPPRLS